MIAEETSLDKNAAHRIVADNLHIQKICTEKRLWSKPVENLSGFAGKTRN
jgi:hypothetical protein